MVRYLRMFYVGWLGIIAGAIVVQLYLAGYGVFAFNGLKPFDAHRALGDLIGIAVIIAAVLAFGARVPWRITIVNLGLVVLFVIQGSLAYASVQGLAALHVVNGVLIFVVTLYLVWDSARFVWPGRVPLDLPGAKAPHA
jgi:hypothetical protein